MSGKYLHEFLKKKESVKSSILVIVIFMSYFSIGLSIYDDYGVHWDETINMQFSEYLTEYVKNIFNNGFASQRDDFKRSHHANEHGPVFELFLGIVKNQLGIEGVRETILFRHKATFIVFFISSVFFYALLRNNAADQISPFIGLFFYILHPRIFAHSFYNTTDISLLAFVTISIYAADQFFKKSGLKYLLFFSFVTGVSINIRIAALAIPFCTSIVYLLRILNGVSGEKRRNYFQDIVTYLVYTAIFMFLLNPFIWNNLGFLKESIKDTINRTGRYFGNFYNLEWIVNTTPLIISILFLIGLLMVFTPTIKIKIEDDSLSEISFVHSLVRTRLKLERGDLTDHFCILILMVSLGLPILFKTELYNSWRHHFFIYSSIVYISFIGLSRLIQYFGLIKPRLAILLTLIFLSYLPALQFMVEYHPNQQVYGSFLAGSRKEGIKDKYTLLDYWMTPHYQGLQYLLNNREGSLNIRFIPGISRNNIGLLKPEERTRIMKRERDFDYIISNQIPSSDLVGENQSNELYSLDYDGVKYMWVFERVD